MKRIDWLVMGKQILTVTIWTVLALTVISGLMGVLVTHELLPLQVGKRMLIALMVVGIFVACVICAKKSSGGKLLISALAAAAITLVHLLLKAIWFSGESIDMRWSLLYILAAALMAGIVASQRKTRKR